MASNSPQSTRKSSALISRYRGTLSSLSARTGVSLPSLITSFAILHEATAIIPLVGVFYACRTFGIGERFVSYVRDANAGTGIGDTSLGGGDKLGLGGNANGWVRGTSERWMKEGEEWTERVGRRYGIWGYPKRGSEHATTATTSSSKQAGAGLAGDVANVLVAYCATKALLPVRIGVALFFSPAFARSVVSPVSRRVGLIFRRK